MNPPNFLKIILCLTVLLLCPPSHGDAATPAIINAQDYGAVADGVTNDSPAIQSAINAAATSGKPSVIILPYSSTPYRIDSPLMIGAHNISLDGQNSTLLYTGNASAIDAIPLSGVYPVNIKISNLLINLQNAGSNTGTPTVGVRFRFSYSRLENVSVALLASHQTGFDLVGDSNGTGPYYNTIINCGVSGHRGLPGWSVANQKGVVFSHLAASTYSSPNANTFMGGRVSAVDVAWHIEGYGNAIYNPTCEGIITTVFEINNPDDINCADNSIMNCYVEGASTAKVYDIGANADRTFIHAGHITSVNSILTDNGSESFINAPGFAYNFPLYPNPQIGLNLFKANNTQIFVFYGNPEGHVVGGPGSLCLNLNGGTNSLYVKQTGNGNTGWVGK